MTRSIIIKIILSLLFYISFAELCFGQTNNTNCSRPEFDENISKILGLFGVNGVNFPSNEEEMDSYCK